MYCLLTNCRNIELSLKYSIFAETFLCMRYGFLHVDCISQRYRFSMAIETYFDPRIIISSRSLKDCRASYKKQYFFINVFFLTLPRT